MIISLCQEESPIEFLKMVVKYIRPNPSVSRTIGDIEAKYKEYDGNPKVVIADPDIFEVMLKKDEDFILLGSDGIFDKVTNEEIVKYMYLNYSNKKSIHENCGNSVDSIIKLSAFKESNDTLSAILIAFGNFVPKKEVPKVEMFGGLKPVSSKDVGAEVGSLRYGKDKIRLMKLLMANSKCSSNTSPAIQ